MILYPFGFNSTIFLSERVYSQLYSNFSSNNYLVQLNMKFISFLIVSSTSNRSYKVISYPINYFQNIVGKSNVN